MPRSACPLLSRLGRLRAPDSVNSLQIQPCNRFGSFLRTAQALGAAPKPAAPHPHMFALWLKDPLARCRRAQWPVSRSDCTALSALICKFGGLAAKRLLRKEEDTVSGQGAPALAEALLPRLLLARQLQLNLGSSVLALGGAQCQAAPAPAPRSAARAAAWGSAAAAAGAPPPPGGAEQSVVTVSIEAACAQAQAAWGAEAVDVDAVLREASQRSGLLHIRPLLSPDDTSQLRAAFLARFQADCLAGRLTGPLPAIVPPLWCSAKELLQTLALCTTRRKLRAAALAALGADPGWASLAAAAAAAWISDAERSHPGTGWAACYSAAQAAGRAPLLAGATGVR